MEEEARPVALNGYEYHYGMSRSSVVQENDDEDKRNFSVLNKPHFFYYTSSVLALSFIFFWKYDKKLFNIIKLEQYLKHYFSKLL